MIPTLTPEQRLALDEASGQPVLVVDAATQKTYYLVESGRQETLAWSWLRDQMQLGVEDIEAGRTVEWSAEQLKERGRAALRAQGRLP